MTYEPRYSGPNRSGICICGCAWDEHHLGMVMNKEYAEQTGEAYVPDECVCYGFNEVGGMKYNTELKVWEDHCHGYRDTMAAPRPTLDQLLREVPCTLHREPNCQWCRNGIAQ